MSICRTHFILRVSMMKQIFISMWASLVLINSARRTNSVRPNGLQSATDPNAQISDQGDQRKDVMVAKAPGGAPNNEKVPPIPNIVHFVYGINDAEEFIFPWHASLVSSYMVNKPESIILHYHKEPTGFWWEQTRKMIPSNVLELRHHRTLPDRIGDTQITQMAHKADIMRLYFLQEEGGVYQDMDTISYKPFAPLLNAGHEFVIGRQEPGKLCNAVMMSIPHSKFVDTWLSEYETKFRPNGWDEASVSFPNELSERLGPQHCYVAPAEAFLRPGWQEPDKIFEGDRKLPKDLVTLHLWHQASEGYLNEAQSWDYPNGHKDTMYGRLLQHTKDLMLKQGVKPVAPPKSIVDESIASMRSPLFFGLL